MCQIQFNLTTISNWKCENVKEEYKKVERNISQERLI